MKKFPDPTIPKQFLDKSKFFMEKHKLPENEGLINSFAALIRNLQTDKEVRRKNMNKQAKGRRENAKGQLLVLKHIKNEYGVEIRGFGLSVDDINQSIRWWEDWSEKTDRGHPNQLINSILGFIFKDLTQMGIKPKKQWDIAYDLFVRYSPDIVEDENMDSDYYERVKAIYKSAKKRYKFGELKTP